MKEYLQRTLELVIVTFLAAAVPALATGGFTKAGVYGAVGAGVAAVYAVLAKTVGDKDKPSVVK